MHFSRFHLVIIAGAFIALLVLGGCSVTKPAASTAPRVFFVEPVDNATVSSPVHVKMGAENFTIEPAGDVKAGSGHLHINVDADCLAAGQGIPKDDTHIHFGKGQLEDELKLAPGEHTLCLQAADGAHVALAGDGMTETIKINVQ